MCRQTTGCISNFKRFRYYPLHVATEPQLKLKLNNHSIVALLDIGAQLSVLPYDFLRRLEIPNLDKVPKRTVRGSPLTLQGPVMLTVTIEDINQLHPFYYVRADVPFILGYDFMSGLGILLDVPRRRVWFGRRSTTTGHLLLPKFEKSVDGQHNISQLTSQTIDVPEHLKELYEKTVENVNLSEPVDDAFKQLW